MVLWHPDNVTNPPVLSLDEKRLNVSAVGTYVQSCTYHFGLHSYKRQHDIINQWFLHFTFWWVDDRLHKGKILMEILFVNICKCWKLATWLYIYFRLYFHLLSILGVESGESFQLMCFCYLIQFFLCNIVAPASSLWWMIIFFNS